MALWTDLEGLTVAGRYELRAHLATGGMAAVFRGWDCRLRRPVAVKLLRDDGELDDTERARFRREARAIAALHSPHIVEVYDFVECDDRTYLIMELVDGPNLKQRIHDAGPLPVAEALTYAIEVCRALAQAHAHGYIHRDIKPQNILLDSSGMTKLTDFGIVRVGGGASLTASGLVLGTADYIAPEQAQGLALVPASDLYALGIVLFEMLTAAVPFSGATATAVALRHTTEPLPPLRARNPGVPPLVERIVRRASAKDPAQRFTSAGQMEAALTHALAVCCPMAVRHEEARFSPRQVGTVERATFPQVVRESVGAATRPSAGSHQPRAPEESEESEESDEPDWHDVALLLSSSSWLASGGAPVASGGDGGASDELSLASEPLPFTVAPIEWELPMRGDPWPLGALRRVLAHGVSARLALTLGAALVLLVAALALRMLP